MHSAASSHKLYRPDSVETDTSYALTSPGPNGSIGSQVDDSVQLGGASGRCNATV